MGAWLSRHGGRVPAQSYLTSGNIMAALLAKETLCRRVRWSSEAGSTEAAMSDNRGSNGKLGAILGALITVAAVAFLLNGGEYVGKKTVNSDNDLPPVATGIGQSK
jgi:hypothetical protein